MFPWERRRVEIDGARYTLAIRHGTPGKQARGAWFWLSSALRRRHPAAVAALGEIHAELTSGRSASLPGTFADGREVDAFVDALLEDLELAVESGLLVIEAERSLPQGDGAARPEPSALPPPGPPAERAAPRAPAPPPATSWDAPDLVASLREASETGAPFWQPCEKCGRALEAGLNG